MRDLRLNNFRYGGNRYLFTLGSGFIYQWLRIYEKYKFLFHLINTYLDVSKKGKKERANEER